MIKTDVFKCAERLSPYILRTPLVESEVLSDAIGRKVYLKLETFQKTGAFKFRGAMNRLLLLGPKAGENGVVTASSGNHGLGMSLGSRILGLKCTVAMPQRAPEVKQAKARKYGAEVILNGNSYDEAAEFAKNLALETNRTYVPSFNDPAIIEGQGTILKEICEDLPDVGLVVAPIGGGGLMAGLLSARSLVKPELQIVGAEPSGAASMKAALDAGKPVTLDEMNTIADGVAVKTAGDITFEVISRWKPDIVIVTDDEIREAQWLLINGAKVMAESAAAVPVAALRRLPEKNLPNNIVCVITGGNIDADELAKLAGSHV